MTVELVKSNGGWTIKCSDSGGKASLSGGSRGGVAMPSAKDVADFIVAIDRAAAGRTHYFTRSDGAQIKAYASQKKIGSIVIERSGGNWIRLGPNDIAELRLKLTRLT